MKKKIISLSKPLALFSFLALMAFTTSKNVQDVSSSFKTTEESAPCGCGGSTKNLDWDEYWWSGTTPMAFQIPNYSFSISGSTVNVTRLVVCANHSPSWSSNNYIGRIYNSAYHPSATRIVNMTSSIGSTWEVTITPYGEFYIMFLSGTPPGTGVQLIGSYTL